MLVSSRVVREPSLGALIAEYSVLHSRFRVIVQVRKGVIDDPGLFSRVFRKRLDIGRSTLIVPLVGDALLRRNGEVRPLEEGELVTTFGDRGWTLRKEKESVSMMVEWETGSLGASVDEGSAARFSELGLKRLRRAAERFTRAGGSVDEAAQATAGILEALRLEGLPFDRLAAEELVEEVPGWAVELNRALDRAISSLTTDPMLVDIETALGWSERQIQRRIKELHGQYASLVDGGWRELHQGWRFTVGASLMSIPGTTTEGVASMLGYSSPRAFCDAFANAGLPSPGAIRERLRGVG